MISRPTTEQILLDCGRELIETVLPAVSDPAVALSVRMMENVLRNAATRAAHEVAWMIEEIEAMLGYARAVLDEVGSPVTADALAAAGDGQGRLHLADVVGRYSAAGEAFSRALEAAMASGDQTLAKRGVDLLQLRTDREQEVKGEWAMIGRG